MQAAVVAEMGGRFEVRNLALDEPGAGEVLVKIDAVGVCHTTWLLGTDTFRPPFPPSSVTRAPESWWPLGKASPESRPATASF
ncbi:hypothetical protein BayCH28_19665 [Mycolicibacterium sp. CH28]|nr:hypothetical protein [Mycolicibacterium sp. CH28]TGD85910.1 hypothetical protein BayCH28_19665 [Mycolicibacterium sp. CH28]